MAGKIINDKLEQTSDDGDGFWDLYLTTGSYSDAPKKRNDGRVGDGIAPPIDAFPCPSPFAAKTVKEAANRLATAPKDVDIDLRYFAALDAHFMANDTLVIGRIGDGGVEG
ncbi:hypothetical protein MMC11_007521 [Xylographa trunciseda]|nr:hypothetical protein [Xylographa trunciseda]